MAKYIVLIKPDNLIKKDIDTFEYKGDLFFKIKTTSSAEARKIVDTMGNRPGVGIINTEASFKKKITDISKMQGRPEVGEFILKKIGELDDAN